MTIETQFNVGDSVTDKSEREGVIDQLRIDVGRQGEATVVQIIYKVNFSGRVENQAEADLNAAD